MKKRQDIIIAITETAIFVALAIVFELLSKLIGLRLPQGRKYKSYNASFTYY